MQGKKSYSKYCNKRKKNAFSLQKIIIIVIIMRKKREKCHSHYCNAWKIAFSYAQKNGITIMLDFFYFWDNYFQ